MKSTYESLTVELKAEIAALQRKTFDQIDAFNAVYDNLIRYQRIESEYHSLLEVHGLKPEDFTASQTDELIFQFLFRLGFWKDEERNRQGQTTRVELTLNPGNNLCEINDCPLLDTRELSLSSKYSELRKKLGMLEKIKNHKTQKNDFMELLEVANNADARYLVVVAATKELTLHTKLTYLNFNKIQNALNGYMDSFFANAEIGIAPGVEKEQVICLPAPSEDTVADEVIEAVEPVEFPDLQKPSERERVLSNTNIKIAMKLDDEGEAVEDTSTIASTNIKCNLKLEDAKESVSDGAEAGKASNA